jgi:hypothetical protein
MTPLTCVGHGRVSYGRVSYNRLSAASTTLGRCPWTKWDAAVLPPTVKYLRDTASDSGGRHDQSEAAREASGVKDTRCAHRIMGSATDGRLRHKSRRDIKAKRHYREAV